MSKSIEEFKLFKTRLNNELLNHRIIQSNKFTNRWENLDLSTFQVKYFLVQFSVFSNQFLVAQLQKCINSETIDDMRESKEILANEIGVIFNSKGYHDNNNNDNDTNGLVSTKGTVDGGVFRFQAAHIEWLYKIASKLDLEFKDIGRRCHGSKSTLFFCDELIRIYGNGDYYTSVAASYAVENWAAAGFWKQLIAGLRRYNEISQSKGESKLPLSFFTWHDKIEDQHAEHTQDELEELYLQGKIIDEDKFIEIGNTMLDAVEIFWNGLYKKIFKSSL